MCLVVLFAARCDDISNFDESVSCSAGSTSLAASRHRVPACSTSHRPARIRMLRKQLSQCARYMRYPWIGRAEPSRGRAGPNSACDGNSSAIGRSARLHYQRGDRDVRCPQQVADELQRELRSCTIAALWHSQRQSTARRGAAMQCAGLGTEVDAPWVSMVGGKLSRPHEILPSAHQNASANSTSSVLHIHTAHSGEITSIARRTGALSIAATHSCHRRECSRRTQFCMNTQPLFSFKTWNATWRALSSATSVRAVVDAPLDSVTTSSTSMSSGSGGVSSHSPHSTRKTGPFSCSSSSARF